MASVKAMTAALSKCTQDARYNAAERTHAESAQHAWEAHEQNVIKLSVHASVGQESSCASAVGRD